MDHKARAIITQQQQGKGDIGPCMAARCKNRASSFTEIDVFDCPLTIYTCEIHRPRSLARARRLAS